MKARQFQSRFWDDEFVVDATWQTRLAFVYLLTCSPMNMCGIFQLSDRKIIFDTGLSEADFEIAKEELSVNKKVVFKGGWVFVANAFKNCKVWKSPTNWNAWEEDILKVKPEVMDYFNTAMDTDIYTSQKQEIEKQKQEQLRKKIEDEAKAKQKKSNTTRMMSSQETDEMIKDLEIGL